MFDASKYQDMYDMFLRYYPGWEGRVRRWAPKNEYSIRLFMSDGSRADYNSRSNSLRWLREFIISSPNDITDEYCRSNFASNLVEYMKAKGFNQITLSERTGLSTAVISKYMRGRTTPTITAAQKIARALNCSVEELLD